MTEVQRLLALTNGCFLKVECLRFTDSSAVIHDGTLRAQSRFSDFSEANVCLLQFFVDGGQ
jgi:hypothetical protein